MGCVSPTEHVMDRLVAACSELPPPVGNYLEDSALRVCALAVVDFRLTEIVVLRAMKRFDDGASPTYGLRTLEDLERFLMEHPDDLEAAQLLWGYNLHTRLAMLRGLASYFLAYKREHDFSSDIEALRHWAQYADFHADFEGRVKGLGIKAFTMAQQRLGVPTVVPDSRIKDFLGAQLGVEPQDKCAVNILNRVADRLGRPRTELDWSIWEFNKERPESI